MPVNHQKVNYLRSFSYYVPVMLLLLSDEAKWAQLVCDSSEGSLSPPGIPRTPLSSCRVCTSARPGTSSQNTGQYLDTKADARVQVPEFCLRFQEEVCVCVCDMTLIPQEVTPRTTRLGVSASTIPEIQCWYPKRLEAHNHLIITFFFFFFQKWSSMKQERRQRSQSDRWKGQKGHLHSPHVLSGWNLLHICCWAEKSNVVPSN